MASWRRLGGSHPIGVRRNPLDQKFSLPVVIHNKSAKTLGCVGAHAPALTYSIYRAGSGELLSSGRSLTRLTQDAAPGETFHYVNVDGPWRVPSDELMELKIEVRRADGSTVTASEPHRFRVADGADKYHADLWAKVALGRHGLPHFVRAAFGLSGVEPWGRWSDADLGESVDFYFARQLPDVFDLVLECYGFKGNAGLAAVVRLGGCVGTFTVPERFETIRLRFRPPAPTRLISITPPRPTRPKDLGLDPDTRRLGIAFASMTIEDLTPSGAGPRSGSTP